MSFLAPGWLAAAPLAVLLLLLLPRRTRKTVATTYLWRKVASEQRSAGRWQRPDLLRVLQMILLTLLVVALAEPRLGTPEHRHTVVVIDGSASMLSGESGGSRLHEALRRANRYLAGPDLFPGEPVDVTLVLAAVEPMVVGVRGGGTGTFPVTMADLPVIGTEPDWRETIALVRALAPISEPSHIAVLTDHRGASGLRDVLAVLPEQLDIEVDVVGDAVANHGLEDVRLVEDARGNTAVQGRIVSHQLDEQDGLAAVPIEVWVTREPGSTPLLWRTTDATTQSEGGGWLEFAVPVQVEDGGVVEVRLRPDTNTTDDRWSFVVGSSALRIGYLGPVDDSPLVSLLAAHPDVELLRIGPEEQFADDVDIMVIEGVGYTAPVPAVPTAWFGAVPDGFASTGGMSATDPMAWIDHPLLDGVSIGDFSVRTARQPLQLEGALDLVMASDGPLVQARHTPHGREAFVAFDSLSTDWSQRLGFAVFLDNLVAWLSEPGPRCTVGERCYLSSVGKVVDVLNPDGSPNQTVSISRRDGSGFVPDSLAASFVPYAGGNHVVLLEGSRAHVAVGRGDTPALDLTAPALSDGAQSAGSPKGPTNLRRALILAVGVLCLLEAAVWLMANGTLTKAHWVGIASRGAVVALLLLAFIDAPSPTVSKGGGVVLIFDEDVVIDEVDTEIMSSARSVVVSRDTVTPATSWETSGGVTVAVPGFDSSLNVASGIARNHRADVAYLSSTGLDHRYPPTALPGLQASDVTFNLLRGEEGPRETDASVINLEAPSSLYEGESFFLVASVFSTVSTSATITVSVDDDSVASYDVDLEPGPNRFDIPVSDISEGHRRVAVSVAVAADAESRNDVMTSTVAVIGVPKVVVLATRPELGSVLADLLRSQGMDADVLEPSRLPRSTTREPATYELLSEHDILVMLDVSASGLAWAQQDDIARWISEAGGGMLVVGGENAFAPGGYLGSRLEEAMPLSTQLPRDKPKVSIVFVIDRSGSMQQESSEVTRLDVATRSTIAAVDLLDESSSVGIVAFDSEAILVRQLEPLQVGPSVEEALADLRPGGGTDLMPAMRLALDQLAEAPDGVQRHVVIMSDGLSRPGPLLQIAAEFADLGATVSTVAIGQGADFKLLTEIAQVGLGVPHLAPDARSLPAILAQEALLMSEELTELGLFQPAVATRPDWLSGVGSPLPPLHGRNPVDKKDDASLVLTTQQADPLLATWQYGLGRVAALASDGVGFWSRDWVSSPDAQRLFAQLTRWLLPTLDSGAGSTATPDQAHVFADLGSSGSAPDYPARLRPYPGTSAYLEGLTALTGGATNLSPAEIPQPRLEVIISRAWRPWAVLAFLTALAGFTLVRGARSQPVGRQL